MCPWWCSCVMPSIMAVCSALCWQVIQERGEGGRGGGRGEAKWGGGQMRVREGGQGTRRGSSSFSNIFTSLTFCLISIDQNKQNIKGIIVFGRSLYFGRGCHVMQFTCSQTIAQNLKRKSFIDLANHFQT